MGFFDDLGANISEKSNQVAEKTKDMMEVTNLNGQISKATKGMQEYYAALGLKYFEAHKADTDAEFQTEVNGINAELKNIEDLQKKVEEIKAKSKVFCPGCGKEVAPGTHFCTSCGTKID